MIGRPAAQTTNVAFTVATLPRCIGAGGALSLGLFALLLGGALPSCSPGLKAAPRDPQAPHGPTVSLRLSGEPKSAIVTVDGRFVGPLGTVALHGVALPRGRHQVSVEAPEYFPWDEEVEAVEAPIVREVRLVPIPD